MCTVGGDGVTGMGADGGDRLQRRWQPRTRTDEPDRELNAAPDTVIEYVAPAGTCAALAPMTEYAPIAAYAAPDTEIEYVAPAGICAAPAPVSARCRVHRASISGVPCFDHRACAYRCLCSA